MYNSWNTLFSNFSIFKCKKEENSVQSTPIIRNLFWLDQLLTLCSPMLNVTRHHVSFHKLIFLARLYSRNFYILQSDANYSKNISLTS